MARVLVIDEDPLAARQVAAAIAQDPGSSAEVATTLDAALAAEGIDAVVVDVRMANTVLPALRARDAAIAVVLTAAAADHEACAKARSQVGPLGWVSRPVDAGELLPRVAAAAERARLQRQVATLERRLARRERALDDSRGDAARTAAQLASASTELATATERLVVAEQIAAVGRVVGGIAHELGEQLALVGYAEALKSKVAHDPELVELADVIVRAQRRLLAMVDAIRDFSEGEAGRPLVREPADVAAVVEEALALIGYDREVRRRRIERRVAGHPICLVHRDKLAQVVINLVHNAALASPPGAAIEVAISEDGADALLTVTDHGVGMEPAVLARLGEPFFTTRGARGSGLGVGICRRIVEEHGGSLAFESEPGRGTTARVRLPVLEVASPMTAARSVWQVLVVDAEPHIPRLIALLLGEGHDVDHAASAAAALERLQARPYDVVLVDLGLEPGPPALPPGGDGEPTLPDPGPSAVALGVEGLLERIHDTWPDLGIVALAAAPTVQSAVAAMRLGAFDVLRKTCGADELRAAIARAGRHGDLAREVRRLRSEVDRARGLGELVGTSAPMRQLLALVERVAASDATVLILGESGTGKELLARTLHRLGPRADQPFVAFDCSALTPSLLEAELFGHERGAFTGAARARRGLFREAHRGTIFLDEIGDIAPSVQNKLLRVLQEREIKPVGADHFVPVDVRVVAATNKDLAGLVARAEFREDLYWRLAVVPIQVPPLRERKDDLPMLAMHLLARRRGAPKTAIGGAARYPTSIAPDALTRLMSYHWPGNIRELENVLSRAAILCDGQKIRATDLDLAGLSPRPGAPRGAAVALAGLGEGRSLKHVVDEAVRAVEQAAIAAALEQAAGSPARAAELLGISRASIYNKMKAYGLER